MLAEILARIDPEIGSVIAGLVLAITDVDSRADSAPRCWRSPSACGPGGEAASFSSFGRLEALA
jgi:hypothetical protein